MNRHFNEYVSNSKRIANSFNLLWDCGADDSSEWSWDLSKIIELTHKSNYYLRDMSPDKKTVGFINSDLKSNLDELIDIESLDKDWQDFIKSATLHKLIQDKCNVEHVISGIIRPLRVLATCCIKDNIKPYNITSHYVDLAVSISNQTQKSGQLSDCIIGITKSIIDLNHISTACPIAPFIKSKRNYTANSRRSKLVKTKDELIDDLSRRKSEEKLPERKAFWELMNIIFTKKPDSYVDAIRFAALKIMLLTGLRVGEIVLIPVDWKRTKTFIDSEGRSPKEYGGNSEAWYLRHFAEKQNTGGSNHLYENLQCIPELFQEIIEITLNDVKKITDPLRETLREQCTSKRHLPKFKAGSIVSALELYPILSGNAVWLDISPEIESEYKSLYLKDFDQSHIADLNKYQIDQYHSGKCLKLNPSAYVFFNRLLKDPNSPPPRDFRGNPYIARRMDWGKVYFQIEDIESYISKLTTKTSDTSPLKTTTGVINPWELMFVNPKRALASERNEGILDIDNYFSVGLPETRLLMNTLGENKKLCKSIFEKYSDSDEDKKLVINSHSFRHLMNTELFRQGVSDALITKHFNRKSIQQSYVYDHRRYSEILDEIEIPPELESELGSNPATVLKLIKGNLTKGPFVDNFIKIQKEQGELAAYSYLKNEADGFHVTPYGYCINSFNVDPCPKHLACFSGCKHLTATNLDSNRKNLINLENKFIDTLNELNSRPLNSIGRDNQIAHATVSLENVRKLLNTKIGERAFPNGSDLSKPTTNRGSVLDEY